MYDNAVVLYGPPPIPRNPIFPEIEHPYVPPIIPETNWYKPAQALPVPINIQCQKCTNLIALVLDNLVSVVPFIVQCPHCQTKHNISVEVNNEFRNTH